LESSLSLGSIEAQSLRSHSLYFLIKRIHFLVVPLVLRFRRLFAAQFFERFLNGQLGSFGHIKPSLLIVGFLLREAYDRAAGPLWHLIQVNDTSTGRKYSDDHQDNR
jgi:hypothetical protein